MPFAYFVSEPGKFIWISFATLRVHIIFHKKRIPTVLLPTHFGNFSFLVNNMQDVFFLALSGKLYSEEVI